MPQRLPTLSTRRLRLRQVEREDADALFRLFGDPERTRYFGLPTLPDRRAADALVASIHDHARDGDLLQWAVTRIESPSLIGTCTLASISAEHRRAELGVAMLTEAEGQGLAAEACRAVLLHAFEERRLHRVYADVDPRNGAAHRLMERLGFLREGHLREHANQHGEWQDGIVYGLLEREWKKQQDETSP